MACTITESRECLDEFAQDISIAGLKYVAKAYGPVIRRVLWAIIVVGFLILTFAHSGKVIQELVDNPIIINVDRKFRAGPVEFPSVIICNTMPFKLSAMNPKGAIHKAFTDIYHSPMLNITEVEKNKKLLSTLDGREFYHSASFTNDDLIIECMWNNEMGGCDPAKDFVPIFHQGKLCYIYNGPTTEMAKNVSIPGPANGLNVMLNSARYEAMNGPYTTYGFEITLGKRSGDADASKLTALVGTTTQIGIFEKQKTYLPGISCGSRNLFYYNMYSKTMCETEVKFNRTEADCQCAPALVPNKTARQILLQKYKSCSVYQTLKCDPTIRRSSKPVSLDVCPVACESPDFDTTSGISGTAWVQSRRLFGGQDESGIIGKMKEKLLIAESLAKRHMPDKNQTTQDVLDGVLESGQALRDTLDRFQNLSMDIPTWKPVHSPPNWEGVDVFSREMNKTMKGLHHALERMSMAAVKVTEKMDQKSANISVKTAPKPKRVRRSVKIDARSNKTAALKQWTSAYLDLQQHMSQLLDEAALETYSWTTMMEENVWRNMASEINDSIVNIGRTLGIQVPQTDSDDHVKFVTFSSNETNVMDAVTCSLRRQSANQTILASFDALNEIIISAEGQDLSPVEQEQLCVNIICHEMGLPEGCDYSDAQFLSMATKLANTTVDLIAETEDVLLSLTNSTNSFINTDVKESEEQLGHLFQDIKKLRQLTTEVNKTVSSRGNVSLWPAYRLEQLNDQLDEVQGYLAENVTYRHISNAVRDGRGDWYKEQRIQLTRLEETITELIDACDEISVLCNQIITTLSGAESAVFSAGFQFVDDEYLWGNESLDILQQMMNEALLKKSFFNETNILLKNNSAEFLKAMRAYEEDTREFLDSLTVDRDFLQNNMLMLSVYLHSMDLEIIEQKNAYTFWSLMADVGGTTSLYTGLSAITVLEFIDFIIIRICMRRKKRKKDIDEKAFDNYAMANNN